MTFSRRRDRVASRRRHRRVISADATTDVPSYELRVGTVDYYYVACTYVDLIFTIPSIHIFASCLYVATTRIPIHPSILSSKHNNTPLQQR